MGEKRMISFEHDPIAFIIATSFLLTFIFLLGRDIIPWLATKMFYKKEKVRLK